MLWNTIDTQLQPILKPYRTYCEIWTQVKLLYTNNIQQLYSMVSNLVNLIQEGISMSEFLEQMASLKIEFNSLLLGSKLAAEDLAQ